MKGKTVPFSIVSVEGLQIFDSRDTPSVMCKMSLSDGGCAWFKVPSGASTGEKEALELRDGDPKRYRGKGVLKAVENISKEINSAVKGLEINGVTQEEFDKILIKLDGTPNKSRLGANAILAVSGAFARAKARAEGVGLWKHFAESNARMPVRQFNILNAGKHADTGFEVQETMVIPFGAESFSEAMEMGTSVWHSLKSVLKKQGKPTGRGDEGGFVNPFGTIDETAKAVLEAISKCGYSPETDVALAFDGAFSEIYGKDLKDETADADDETYHFGGRRATAEDIVAFWEEKIELYPIISIEDGIGEKDTDGWRLLTKRLGSKVQLVVDDYICTNPAIIRQAIKEGLGNSNLIKLNQIGTVTETLEAMKLTVDSGRTNVLSHRSGETEDDFIGHFAMHERISQIKSGSSGSDRMAKYNALLMIEQDLGPKAVYPGLNAFPTQVKEHWKQRQ